MRSPHRRHRPRRSSHENTGMLSRAPISAPHAGHRDRGRTIDSPFGSRYAATVMKLPTTSPNGSATIARIHASSTRPNPTRVPTGDGGTPGVGRLFVDVGDVLLETRHA